MDLLPQMLARQPDLGVIVVTAFASIESAVNAIRRGAVDYVPKAVHPIRSDWLPVASSKRSGSEGVSPNSRRSWTRVASRPSSNLEVPSFFVSADRASGGRLRGRRPAPRRKWHRKERPRALDSRQQSAR